MVRAANVNAVYTWQKLAPTAQEAFNPISPAAANIMDDRHHAIIEVSHT